MGQTPWCVGWLRRDGSRVIGVEWCATKTGKRFDEGENNVPTRCAHFVTLPCGMERREPTCGDGGVTG